MIIRGGFLLTFSLWAVWTAAHLQFEQTYGFSIGGAIQYSTMNLHGWPRSDAFTRHEQQVMAKSSVFGDVRYERTTTNQFNYSAICFNLLLSFVLVFSIIRFLVLVFLSRSNVQYSVATTLILVTAICLTISMMLNERELYESVFGGQTSSFSWPMRLLDDLNWHQRIFVVMGIFLALVNAMHYATRICRLKAVGTR